MSEPVWLLSRQTSGPLWYNLYPIVTQNRRSRHCSMSRHNGNFFFICETSTVFLTWNNLLFVVPLLYTRSFPNRFHSIADSSTLSYYFYDSVMVTHDINTEEYLDICSEGIRLQFCSINLLFLWTQFRRDKNRHDDTDLMIILNVIQRYISCTVCWGLGIRNDTMT